MILYDNNFFKKEYLYFKAKRLYLKSKYLKILKCAVAISANTLNLIRYIANLTYS